MIMNQVCDACKRGVAELFSSTELSTALDVLKS